ncbi:MAG TPA: DNA-binding response regulator [Rikenellaceae bacterium]|nr:DNA-binding response regulator [Rikenellaceae bacterium]
MNTISCIVIDDEPLAVRLMESYVTKTPFLSLKGSFTSGTSAYSFLQDTPVELLFCDIQMPNLSGMELSRMLPEKTRIIFTTAFSEYAVEGFRVRALDYLLKPVSYDDFLSAALKAKEYFEHVEVTAQRKIKSIFVKTEYRLQQIDLDKITYIEGLKDYIKIHLSGSSAPILSLMRMKVIEDTLPKEYFVRIHKSFIVRLAAIEAIERNHILIGKDRIPIGETYQSVLYQALSDTILTQDKG